MDTQTEFRRYEGVGISSEAIWQSENGRMIERLTKETVVSCALQYGSPEQKPIVSACVGLLLMSPGVLLVQHVLAVIRGGVNLAKLRYEAAMILIVGLGFWLFLQSVIRRRYFVLVTAREKSVRLVFNRAANLPDIKDFIADGRKSYGWEIDDRSSV